MKKLLLVVLLMVVAVGSASADTIIFSTASVPPFTWTFNGTTLTLNSGFLVASDLDSSVIGGTATIVATLSGSGPGVYSFSGGTFTATCTGVSGTCFSGTLGSFDVNQGTTTASFDSVDISGTVNSNLLVLLGITNPNTFVQGSAGGSINGQLANLRGAGGEFGATVNQVPEPASLALLGTGLFGLGGVIRRKLA